MAERPEQQVFHAKLNATHAENRQALLTLLMASGREDDAVRFIGEVKTATQGRLHRHRWIDVARRYVKLEWDN